MLSLRAMFFFGSSMRRGFTFFRSFLFCATLATAASAQPAPDPGAAEKQFAQMMASEHGLDAAAVLETLHRAQYRQSVIDTMTPFAPCMLTPSSSGLAIAFSAAASARPSPSASPA